jgi:hypothetical protein
VASIPAVKALEGRYGARGLRVVSVTHDTNRDRVESTAKEHGMHYPAFLDAERSWQRSAGISLVPAFLVVDKSGRLAYVHRGKLVEESDAFARMAGVIEQALIKG